VEGLLTYDSLLWTQVPLWLALALKKFHRCKILPPSWLAVDKVEGFIAEEKENEEELQAIPFYFSEVCSLSFKTVLPCCRAVRPVQCSNNLHLCHYPLS